MFLTKLLYKNHIIFFILFIICLSLYANTLKNDFIFDDINLIVSNPYVKNLKFLPFLLVNDIYHNSPSGKSNYYRPIQLLSYSLDYKIWMLNPLGFHLTNIALHALVAYLLYILVFKLFCSRQIAIFSSILFAIHPIHTTVVSYIASRADILVALFTMLTVIAFVEFLYKMKSKFIVMSIGSYVLALLSRENAIILPFLLLSFLIVFKNKIKVILKYSIPFFIVIFFYIVLRLETGINNSSIIFKVYIPLKLWIINFLHIIKEYTFLILFPHQLRISRSVPFIKNINFLDLTTNFMLLLFALIIIKKRNITHQRQLLFLYLWIIIAISPIVKLMFLYPFQGITMAENWLYLPSIGVFSLIGYIFSTIYKKIKFLSISFFVVIIVLYSYITIRSNAGWQDSLHLYNYLITAQPSSNIIKFNYAVEMADKGKLQEAIEELQEILITEPKAWDVYLAMGNIYYYKKDLENALTNYNRVLELKPDSDLAHLNIGIVYMNKGEKDKAFDYLFNALEINPRLWQGYFYAGNLYEEKNLHPEAIICYEKIIELNPNFTQVYLNLGIAYGNSKQFKKTIEIWEKYLKLNKNDATVKNHIKRAQELLKN